MNFISHYYFDQTQPDSYQVLGAVLPDLIKNANKRWNLFPQKRALQYQNHKVFGAILKGWKKHLQIDALFHSSDFFLQQTAKLKACFLPVLENSVIRLSFLAHIELELMLDHLLVSKKIVDIHAFYKRLAEVDLDEVVAFLEAENVHPIAQFVYFFEIFRTNQYLFNYENLEYITLASDKICSRIWNAPFSDTAKAAITKKLTEYKVNLEFEFMTIFNEIELRLT